MRICSHCFDLVWTSSLSYLLLACLRLRDIFDTWCIPGKCSGCSRNSQSRERMREEKRFKNICFAVCKKNLLMFARECSNSIWGQKWCRTFYLWFPSKWNMTDIKGVRAFVGHLDSPVVHCTLGCEFAPSWQQLYSSITYTLFNAFV